MKDEAKWIRLSHIASMSEKILREKVINIDDVKQLDVEVTAMLKQMSRERKYFQRLS